MAAINLEYNKPSSDALGMSRGAFDYHNYFICQLRYKNPTVQIDVSTDQVAVPFMTIHFKGLVTIMLNMLTIFLFSSYFWFSI